MLFLLACWFISIALIGYSYVIYPILLKLLTNGKQTNTITYNKHELPEIALFFAAYNEEKVIEQKLKSIIDTNYPLPLLKVYVGSDNSTDNTDNIIQQYAAQYPEIICFKQFAGRSGKIKIINELIEDYRASNGQAEVLLFTDANVFFTPDMLYHLVKHFKNPAIGQVGANVINSNVQAEGISFQEMAYIQRENNIKYMQGLHHGAMIGAFGACYAVRATLWQAVPSNFLVDDFYTGMHVLQQDALSIFEKEAVCYEDVSNDVAVEFNRKKRMSAGNFQNLHHFAGLLLRFDAVAFHFFSHKVLRWLTPFLILIAFAASVALCFYFTIFIPLTTAFLALICAPFADKLLSKAGYNFKLLRFVAYFVNMNMALLAGWVMFMRGIQSAVWTPTKRNI